MSRRAARSPFTAIKCEGGLLPHDLLQRIAARDPRLPGARDTDYGILEHQREGEVVNRAWTDLLGTWTAFADSRARDADPHQTRLTRDRFLVPLFQALGYGRLTTLRSNLEVEGRPFPISHLHEPTRTAVHLLGAGVSLETSTVAVRGAARSSPHGLVQDFLNRSQDHDWAFLSNGLILRVLRDNRSLTRQAYLEFDLEQIFDDERYSEFRVLWLVCHESRVRREGTEPCLLERWFEASKRAGVAARDQMRDGVKLAIERLGSGFLRRRENATLQRALADGTLDRQDYYRQLLRLVYRLIFVFVAEDRDLLLLPEPAPPAPKDPALTAARARYAQWYSTAPLRALAQRRRGGPHTDLYRRLRAVLERLHEGSAALALPALGSFLWRADAMPALAGADIGNEDLLTAIRALVEIEDDRVRRPVNWSEVGADELGSIYESLLELHPRIEREAATFTLETAAGHERKTTGSYYTPTSLVDCLLDSALDPVLEEKARAKDPEAAILGMKVVDPACGSGHFIVAAGRRIARRLSLVRSGDDEPSPEAYRHALRDVVGRCLFGVDLNPMAVELCKVSLWLEAIEPGRPLSFLDAHIQCGNSLLGTTPALLARGIPDEAFSAIEGDEKEVVKRLKKRHKDEKKGRGDLFEGPSAGGGGETLAEGALLVEAVKDDTFGHVVKKEVAWTRFSTSEAVARAKLTADAWCAAFVQRKDAAHETAAITHAVLKTLRERGPAGAIEAAAEVARLAQECRFLHWHIAFPQVFGVKADAVADEEDVTGWTGGFDVVLGNPPWERVKLQEQEFFASRSEVIAKAENASARKKLIAVLPTQDKPLWDAWCAGSREAEGQSHLIRQSGRYPLCGKGDVNTYTVFAEAMRSILAATGRLGCILPSGIATDDTTKHFFDDLISRGAMQSFFDFQSGGDLFGDIGHARFKFALMTIGGAATTCPVVDFVFFARNASYVRQPESHISLSAEDIALLNPNTRTCPIFRSRRDAGIAKAIFRRVPVLLREGPPEENPWGVSFARLFDMASDSSFFRSAAALRREEWSLEGGNVLRCSEERYVPLYEAKLVHQFDHRYGDYADQPEGSESTSLPDVPLVRLQNPACVIQPRYWVSSSEVERRLAGRWDRGWLLGWRDICRATDERTVIASVIPRLGVGDKFLLMLSTASPTLTACLMACLNSLSLDFAARQKVGGTNLKYFTMKQLPVLPPQTYDAPTPWSPATPLHAWILPRVLELTYTAWDLEPFAKDCGYDGPPFRWDEARRFLLRCELDAAFFHLYGIARDDVDYIMDTFPIVRRNDEKAHGEYRTKRVILEVFDAMQRAIETGKAYETRLDPRPADASVAHPPKALVGETPAARIARIKGHFEEVENWIADLVRDTKDRKLWAGMVRDEGRKLFPDLRSQLIWAMSLVPEEEQPTEIERTLRDLRERLSKELETTHPENVPMSEASAKITADPKKEVSSHVKALQ